VPECKKIFQEAKSELLLTGRKTILYVPSSIFPGDKFILKCDRFCDEIHRFSKSQQDVFLQPVESGEITL
jgi:putative ATPase